MAALTEVARPVRDDRLAAVHDLLTTLLAIVLMAAGLFVAFWLTGVGIDVP